VESTKLKTKVYFILFCMLSNSRVWMQLYSTKILTSRRTFLWFQRVLRPVKEWEIWWPLLSNYLRINSPNVSCIQTSCRYRDFSLFCTVLYNWSYLSVAWAQV
jgi:hypothetical protein